MKQEILFSSPFNGDLSGLHKLYIAGARKFYGCANTPSEKIGSGRVNNAPGKISWDTVVKAIPLIKSLNASFEYIINQPFIPGIETDIGIRKKCVEQLKRIESAGATSIKISSPFIASLAFEHTSLHVAISKFARIRSVQQAIHWERLGASSICLEPSLNREIRMIQSIRDAIRCKIEILGNDSCLTGCPFALAHADYSSRFSNGDTEDIYNHYYSLRCLQQFISHPVNLIKASFIRPEDVETYQRIGIDYIKFTDRTKDTPWIENVLQNYKKGFFHGNIADFFPLFSAWNNHRIVDETEINEMAEGLKGGAPFKINQFCNLLPCILKITIDNDKLSSLSTVIASHQCDGASCGTVCRLCNDIASKVISFDTNNLKAVTHLLDLTIKKLEKIYK
jgi:collagenase-like PrtC family protease